LQVDDRALKQIQKTVDSLSHLILAQFPTLAPTVVARPGIAMWAMACDANRQHD
jgi:hypothetical protein